MHIDPIYFLDRMTKYEALILVEEHNEQHKERWERERFNAYITALSNGAELEGPMDLICFPWEEKPEQKKLSQKEVEARRKRMRDTYEQYKKGELKPVINMKNGKI